MTPNTGSAFDDGQNPPFVFFFDAPDSPLTDVLDDGCAAETVEVDELDELDDAIEEDELVLCTLFL